MDHYMSIVNLTAQSSEVASPLSGDVYLDDGTNTESGVPALRYYDGANWNTLADISTYRKTTAIADATVANTVTETTVIGTLKTGDSLQFAADTLTIGKTIRVTVRGIVSNTGTPTLNIIAKLGGTTIFSSGAITTASGLSDSGFAVHGDITIRTTGASATLASGGILTIDGNTYDMPDAGNTINTTGALTLDVTATWGTADASNTITGEIAIVEVLT